MPKSKLGLMPVQDTSKLTNLVLVWIALKLCLRFGEVAFSFFSFFFFFFPRVFGGMRLLFNEQ